LISYIRGIYAENLENAIVVEANGIGYYVNFPDSKKVELPPLGKEVVIYTFMSVTQDDVALFGMQSREEVDMFMLLKKVDKIGSKTALGILGTLSVDQIKYAILSGDKKTLCRAPGIADKGASKIILELKDKIELPSQTVSSNKNNKNNENINNALEALEQLGYNRSEAMKAVSQIKDIESLDDSKILSLALKNLG